MKVAYESLETETCSILRVGDIKAKLAEKFTNKITFSSIGNAKARNKHEYILPAGESLPSEVITAAYHGGGIPNTAMLRATATRLHHQIVDTRSQRKWPPTPQDILQDANPFNVNTFNFLAWLIDPGASLGDNGMVKLSSKRKVLDTIHRLGYGIPYTETLFIENKWAEWDRNQNSRIPANISKNIPTTLVADNIDWKNKSIGGRETHNTNCILIQHQILSDNSGRPNVNLQATYDFDRKKHTSLKTAPTELPKYLFKKTPCKRFYFPDTASLINIAEHSVKTSLKTIAWVLFVFLEIDNIWRK